MALTQALTVAPLEASSVQHSPDEAADAPEEGGCALSGPPRLPACIRAVELELWRDRQPIEGLLRAPDGSERPFRGWLELINLLVLASEGDDQQNR